MTGSEIEHKDGVGWWEAPAPKKRHDHFAQTKGWSGWTYVERCPCGAIGDGIVWTLLDAPRVAKPWWRAS